MRGERCQPNGVWRAIALAASCALLLVGQLAEAAEGLIPRRPVPASVRADTRYDTALHRQSRLFSCGAAAISSYSTFWLGDALSEQQVLDLLFSKLDVAERKKVELGGLSPSQMSLIVRQLGYSERWEQVRFDDLAKIRPPVVVFIDYDGQPHWAIFKGIQNGEIYLGDPAVGNIRVTPEEFRRLWALEDNGNAGLMWAFQRNDRMALGPSSPLLLGPESHLDHRTLQQVRTALVLGDRAAGSFRGSVGLHFSSSGNTFAVDNILVREKTRTISTVPALEYWMADGLSVTGAASHARTSTTASAGGVSETEQSSEWRDLAFSVRRAFSVSPSLMLSVALQLQVPIAAGTRGAGMSISAAKSIGRWTHMLDVDYLRQFSPSTDAVDVRARPAHHMGVGALSQYSITDSTAAGLFASLGRSSSRTVGLGDAVATRDWRMGVTLVTRVTRDVTVQPSISYGRTGEIKQVEAGITFFRMF